MTMAGPAPGRSASPTIAVPVVAKMPAPMVAPTPRAVRCHLLSERLSPPRSMMSFSQSSTDFRRKSRLINDLGWNAGDACCDQELRLPGSVNVTRVVPAMRLPSGARAGVKRKARMTSSNLRA